MAIQTTTFKGARYLVKFHDPIQWSASESYEAIEAVQYNAYTYISKQPVPAGVQISNTDFWLLWADPNAQMEQLRQLVSQYVDDVENLNTELAAEISNREAAIDEAVSKYSYSTNNPIYYGADKTGVNDSSDAINACIEANHNGQIVFSPGTYLVENPIELDYMLDYATCIDFNGAIIINNVAIDYLLGIGTKNYNANVPSGGSFSKDKRCCFIKNFHFITDAEYAIKIERNFLNARIESFEIEAEKNGIYIGVEHSGLSNAPTDAYISDFVITNKDMTQNYVGILIHGSDNKISHGRIYGFKNGISGIVNFVDEIHFLATNLPTDGTFKMNKDYKCIELTNNGAMITNCYCDSIPVFMHCSSDSANKIYVQNLFIYAYGTSDNYMSESSIFDFSNWADNSDATIFIDSVYFQNGTYPDFAKFIELPDINSLSANAATVFRKAQISRVKMITPSKQSSLATDIYRTQEKLPLVNNWGAASTTIAGEWAKLCTIISPRPERMILRVNFIEREYALRLNTTKSNGKMIYESGELYTATPYSSNMSFKICTNNDGYFDVFYKYANNTATPSDVQLSNLISKWSIAIPASIHDAAFSMPSYSDATLNELYTSTHDFNVQE